jgi:heterodisulfide reductase subunit A-like polyferredoxin
MIASKEQKKTGAVLVVGGGIAGIQASIDLAESGQKVYLLTTSPSIGGTMPRLDKTFPTNDCSMCILSPKLVEAGRHLNIELITYADLESIEGGPGRFAVTIRKRPRYVDPEKCTGCGLCGKVDVPAPEELVEHDGELWVKRLEVDEVKCVQCGDCARACEKENPDAPAMSSVFQDQTLGDAAGAPTEGAGAELRGLLAMPADDRVDWWRRAMSKCIKCYGCRDICPVFVESECAMEDWATPGRLPPDAPLYHLARAYYIAERCTHCGFCEDTCPSKLPLRALVDVVRHEDRERLFEYVPGASNEVVEKIRNAFPAREKEEAPA